MFNNLFEFFEYVTALLHLWIQAYQWMLSRLSNGLW